MKQNGKFIAVGFNIKSNEACPNIDYKYGPYASIDEAYDALGEDGDDVIAIGLTVGIMTDEGIVEYWWKNGITKDDLVPKGGDTTDMSLLLETLSRIDQNVISISNRLDIQEGEQENDEWDEV